MVDAEVEARGCLAVREGGPTQPAGPEGALFSGSSRTRGHLSEWPGAFKCVISSGHIISSFIFISGREQVSAQGQHF